jgi:hypothetical protein
MRNHPAYSKGSAKTKTGISTDRVLPHRSVTEGKILLETKTLRVIRSGRILRGEFVAGLSAGRKVLNVLTGDEFVNVHFFNSSSRFI